MTELPWRRETWQHATGVPAWSAATSRSAPEKFRSDLLPGVTPDWAWGGADGAGIHVCVLDSGVDGSHPLIGTVTQSMKVTTAESGSVKVVECEAEDLAGHGTACAGIIRSLAPAVSLSSVRVLTEGRSGSGEALLAGLRWAIDQGFDLINLSLATAKEDLATQLHSLIDRAFFRRSTLVVSANNRPVRSYPWSFASVISVASHDEPEPMKYYVNPSPPAEYFARGVSVPIAWSGGGRIRSTGNSFAAPHITGICALILSKHPWLTPTQLKSALFQCAHNMIPELERFDDYHGVR
ncbi:S8 family serine peptidase [Streptomyces sp. NPDC096354]|uniref:S8 family serine peptidase n=1 Tax=Streptomyces sp. NPDC096354 TaxID=3366088 RepID=UPI00380DF60C